jgi:hypothetical protein
VEVVAVVALGGSVEDEAPRLAAELGLTVYETAVMLRAPPPVIVYRSEDHTRTADVVAKLRSRGHDAILCGLDEVVSSEDMFRPKAFRFESGDLVGLANGEEQRLQLASVFALVRANHSTRTEDTIETKERKLSLGRAALSGGLIATKTSSSEHRRVFVEREPVLYMFRIDAARRPWLLISTQLRYDGLGQEMLRSKPENFEVLVKNLRELATSAMFDTRLLAVRAATTIVNAGPKHLNASSSATIDLLAHIVATSLGKTARPYR